VDHSFFPSLRSLSSWGAFFPPLLGDTYLGVVLFDLSLSGLFFLLMECVSKRIPGPARFFFGLLPTALLQAFCRPSMVPKDSWLIHVEGGSLISLLFFSPTFFFSSCRVPLSPLYQAKAFSLFDLAYRRL